MSGYVHCACGTCFETTIGEPGDLCQECQDAGCEPEMECRVPPEPEPEGFTSPVQAAEERLLEGQRALPFAQALQDLAQAIQEGRAVVSGVVLGASPGSFRAAVVLQGEHLYLDSEGRKVLALGGEFTLEVKPT